MSVVLLPTSAFQDDDGGGCGDRSHNLAQWRQLIDFRQLKCAGKIQLRYLFRK